MQEPLCRDCKTRHKLGAMYCPLFAKGKVVSESPPKFPKPEMSKVFLTAINEAKESVSGGDGVALTSISHPPGLIRKLTKEIKPGGKLCLCPCCALRRHKILAAVKKHREKKRISPR